MVYVEVVVDKGAMSEKAKEKYEEYIKDIGEECKDGYLFDNLDLDDAYFEDGKLTLYFSIPGAKVCEDVSVYIELDLSEVLGILANNKKELLKAIDKLKEQAEQAKTIIEKVDESSFSS